MKHSFLFFTCIAGITFFTIDSHAQTISSVGSPKVSKGVTAVAARIGYSENKDGGSQDERLRSRLHIDHGFTDSYAARLIVAGDKRQNDTFEYDSLTFENRFDLYDAQDIGFDFGMRASYTLKDGDKKPDNVTVGFYELFPLDDWEIRANQFLSHEVGEDSESGVGFSMRAQATYALNDNHRLGLETFNNFGNIRTLSGFDNQSHSLGPVLKGKLGNGFAYETGYLAGISDNNADHNIKLFLSKKF